jgi:pyrimidine operon attenuation protein/uracil phosphoribosyltransferase
MSVIKVISAPFRLAKWCVAGNKLECFESAKRIGKLLKAEKRDIQQQTFDVTVHRDCVDNNNVNGVGILMILHVFISQWPD